MRQTDAHRLDSRDARKTESLPDGLLTVQAHTGGAWFLIQIGRASYTKRFNLSAAEAAQLVEKLAPLLEA